MATIFLSIRCSSSVHIRRFYHTYTLFLVFLRTHHYTYLEVLGLLGYVVRLRIYRSVERILSVPVGEIGGVTHTSWRRTPIGLGLRLCISNGIRSLGCLSPTHLYNPDNLV